MAGHEKLVEVNYMKSILTTISSHALSLYVGMAWGVNFFFC